MNLLIALNKEVEYVEIWEDAVTAFRNLGKVFDSVPSERFWESLKYIKITELTKN